MENDKKCLKLQYSYAIMKMQLNRRKCLKKLNYLAINVRQYVIKEVK